MTVQRPLSPHITIYRPMLTMLMSIAHRISGAALYGAFLLVAAWLAATATGGGTADFARDAVVGWPGRIVMIGASWALFHHMLGGIRHLIWDTGRGYALPTVEWFAQATLIGGVALTAVFWALAW